MPEQWGDASGHKVDFFNVKGDLENLLLPGVAIYERVVHPAMQPGRSSQIVVNGQRVGVLGELHPQWVQKYDLPAAPIVFELELEALTLASVPSFSELSRFPAVTRDLAIVVDQNLPLNALVKGMREASPALDQEISLFDLYAGKGVPENKKSLAFRIVMQDTQRTLQDVEVDGAVQNLIEYLQKNFDAQLRA